MKFRKPILMTGLIVLSGALIGPAPVWAETIAMIGTGPVTSALGPRFATLGHDIVYGSRSPERRAVRDLVARTSGNASAMLPADAARDADIVVLAVPWEAAEAVVMGLGDLSGKIILDPTNAVRRDADGVRHHSVATSTGQIIQIWAPDAMVVKAFNTLSAETMADPRIAGGPVTIPIAGNDREAKAVVADLVTGIGFEVVDMGMIDAAHTLEQMLIVRGNAGLLGSPFNYYFRPIPQN